MGKRHIRIPAEIVESGLIEFFNAAHFKLYSVLDLGKDKNIINKNLPSAYYKTLMRQQTILKKTKLSLNSIIPAVKDLENWGLIKTESGKGRGRVTKYFLYVTPKIKYPSKNRRQKDEQRIARKKRIKRDKKGKFPKSTTYEEKPPKVCEPKEEKYASFPQEKPN